MNCSRCGNVIQPNSGFCGACGNPVNNGNVNMNMYMNNQVVSNPNMGKLIVTRENNFVGCAANLDVYINGALYKLSNGGRYDFDLAPGLYTIDYKVWCRRKKTIQINIVAGNFYLLEFTPDFLWGGFQISNKSKLQ